MLFRRTDLCLSEKFNFNLTGQKRSPSLHFCFENRNLLLLHMNSDNVKHVLRVHLQKNVLRGE